MRVELKGQYASLEWVTLNGAGTQSRGQNSRDAKRDDLNSDRETWYKSNLPTLFALPLFSTKSSSPQRVSQATGTSCAQNATLSLRLVYRNG